jgi:hypothetical protein
MGEKIINVPGQIAGQMSKLRLQRLFFKSTAMSTEIFSFSGWVARNSRTFANLTEVSFH